MGLTKGSSVGTLRDWGEHAIPTPGNVGVQLPAVATGSWGGSENSLLGVIADGSQSGLTGAVNLANATGAKAIVCIKY